MLIALLALLIVPFAAVKIVSRGAMTTAFQAGLSAFFAFTGVGHFLKTQEMSLMLGSDFPLPILSIYASGVLELLAAVGVWLPRWRKMTGCGLVAMMIGFLPFNIYAAINRVPFGGHELGPAYLMARVPFQFLVIWWIGKACSIKPINFCRSLKSGSKHAIA